MVGTLTTQSSGGSVGAAMVVKEDGHVNSVIQTLLSFLGFVECLGNGLSVEGAAGEGLGTGSLTTVDANGTCLGVEASSTPVDRG